MEELDKLNRLEFYFRKKALIVTFLMVMLGISVLELLN